MDKAIVGVLGFFAVMSFLTFYIPNAWTNGSWVWVRSTVTGNYGEAVVGTGTALYIARGTSFYRYLPAGNSWVGLKSPPKPDGSAFKTGTALAWDLGNYIYALYGAAQADSRRWFYRYSISNDFWEALTSTTTDQGEADAIAFVGKDNRIYATIGGESRQTHLVRYDPTANNWSDIPTDPPGGMGDGASLVWTGGEFLYALRGEFLEDSPLNDFWRYNLTSKAWTVMADIPADAHGGGVGGVGDGGSLVYVGSWLSDQIDYLYALSGNQAYPETPVIPDNRTYRYVISTNSWEPLANLPFGIGYYVGCRLGYAEGRIYAWQGAPSTWTGGGDDLAEYELPRSDSEPPMTNHNYDGLWHTADFTIALSATDDSSGINETYYSINNSQIQNVSTRGQPVVTSEGANNTLEYWSVDNVGHEESHHILTGIKLDKTIPVGSIVTNNGSIYSNSTSVTLSMSATDAVSSVYSVRFSNDGVWDTELWESLSSTKSWTLTPGDGIKTVYSQIKDYAGLASITYTSTIFLDTTNPVIATPLHFPDGDVQQNQVVKISVDVTDSGSGVKSVRLAYFTNKSSVGLEFSMTLNQTNGLYQSIIIGQEAGTLVKYQITAYDNADNNATNDNAGQYYIYTVIPEFSSILIPQLLLIATLTTVTVHRRKCIMRHRSE